MTGVEILFALLGAVAVAAALLVVGSPNLVHAALWLVVTLGALAGCYLLLTAEFVAWVQVLIYVGAVVVLLLFGLMLTRAPIGYSAELTSGNRWAAAVVAGATGGTLVTVIVEAFRREYVELHGGVAGASRGIGETIFRYWVLPFEILSVLLLAALVGAIVLSRRTPDEARPAAGATAGALGLAGGSNGTGRPGGGDLTDTGTGTETGQANAAPPPTVPTQDGDRTLPVSESTGSQGGAG
jgi:NADH-quinone oxidoreductase subunit J